jgi:hypothetical protein
MRYALVYGGIGGAVTAAIFSAIFTLDLPSHATSVWFGYLVMLASLSLIFVGMKRYRDVECGGVIRFAPAFRLGLAMAAVAAAMFALGWELFLVVSGFDFMSFYTAQVGDGLRAQGTAPEVMEARLAEMRALAERYENPLFRMAVSVAEIAPAGLFVALASAGLLRNPKLLPARR